MTVYTKLRITALLTLALLGLVTAVGSAGSVSILVNIDDLTEGTPSLSLSGPSPLPTPIIVASGSEFLHFRLPVAPSAASTKIYSQDLQSRSTVTSLKTWWEERSATGC